MNSKVKAFFTNENQSISARKQLQYEQQKLHSNEQRIIQLRNRKEHLSQQNQQLTQHITQLKEKIKKQQQYDNPVVKQLRDHFKALREQMRAMAQEEDEGDDVDIDNMTYEELLELGQTIGKVSKGLASSKFEALEKFVYENDLNLQQECTICRQEFEDGHECVKLPCMHFFHRECLKGWTGVEKVCPNCKAEIK